MINTLGRILINTLYLVPWRVKRFKNEFPDAQVIVAGATKARKMKADSEPRSGAGWITARRNALILATTGLRCGDWTIPLESIREATLYKITGGYLLILSAADGFYYQFGLDHDPAWEKQSLFPMEIQSVQLKLSPYNLIVRLLLTALGVWSLIQDYVQQTIDVYVVLKIVLLIWVLMPLLRSLKASSK